MKSIQEPIVGGRCRCTEGQSAMTKVIWCSCKDENKRLRAEITKTEKARDGLQFQLVAMTERAEALALENERLRNTGAAQETALGAVDNWLLEHGDTTYLLSRVQHLDEFMSLAVEDAEARATVLAGLLRKGLTELDRLVQYGDWTVSDESPGHHPTLPSAVVGARSVAQDIRTELEKK